jgi:hypothetical protein
MSETDLLTEEDRKAEAKRIADRDRKRSKRAVKKSKRDEVSLLAQARRDAEAQAEDAARIRREREALIVSEFTPPISETDGDVPGYWNWVLTNLDDFLAQFESGSFERTYQHLSVSPAGRLALQYLGVAPMDCIAGCIADSEGIHAWAPLPASTNPNESSSPVKLSSELTEFYRRQMEEKFAKTELEDAEKKRRHRENMRELEHKYLTGRRAMKARLV